MDLNEFAQYLRLDKSRLDEELIEQPEIFYNVSEAVADAIAERDMLKEALATTDAKLDGEARVKIEKDGDKVTEAAVKSWVQTSKKHEAAFEAYVQAKTRADKLLGLKESFKARNDALKELCGLYTSNYYQVDSVRSAERTDKARYHVTRNRIADERTKRQG